MTEGSVVLGKYGDQFDRSCETGGGVTKSEGATEYRTWNKEKLG